MRCLAYRSEGLGPFNKEEEVANRSGINGVSGVDGINGVNGVDGVHAQPCLRLG